MPVNKTMYVRDEDAPIWDKAKDIVGESLSAYLTAHLRNVVTANNAAKKGDERIVLTFQENGIPRTIAFYGHWLIFPNKPFDWDRYPDDPDASIFHFAVAITAKGRIAVFEFLGRNDNGTYTSAWFRSFDSFEEANADGSIPGGLIAEAMEIRGIPLEELDI
jgi:hypothetical protein